MRPLRSPLGVWSAHRAHPVLQVGEVRVPAQRQAVDVGDSELGGHEEEVHQLGSWPNAPVGLRGGAECGEGRGLAGRQLKRGGAGSEGVGLAHLVEFPELVPQLLAALIQGLALQAAKAWEGDQEIRVSKAGEYR